MNLFKDQARVEQTANVVVRTEPKHYVNPSNSKESWYCDCDIAFDGVVSSIRAFHNAPTKPTHIAVGQTVTLTATRVDGKTFISLPQE